MKGLNDDPGWRIAWVTWLNLLRSYSNPPVSARIAPSRGEIARNAASACGSCEIVQRALVVLRQPYDGAAPDTLRRGRLVGEAAGDELERVALRDQRVAGREHGLDLACARVLHDRDRDRLSLSGVSAKSLSSAWSCSAASAGRFT